MSFGKGSLGIWAKLKAAELGFLEAFFNQWKKKKTIDKILGMDVC